MSPGTKRSERRKKSRKRPASLVYVELPSNGGGMQDLSEEGFSVCPVMPVRAGEKTPFAFFLDEDTRIEGRGQIVWVQDGGFVAGVRFTEIPPAALEQIRKWLAQRETPSRREQSGESQTPARELPQTEGYSAPPGPREKTPIETPAASPVLEPRITTKEPDRHSLPSRAEKKSPAWPPVEPAVPEPAVATRQPPMHSVLPPPEERIPIDTVVPAVPKSAEPPVSEPAVPPKQAPMRAEPPPAEEKVLSGTPAGSLVPAAAEPQGLAPIVTTNEPERRSIPSPRDERISVEPPVPAVPEREPLILEPALTPKETQPAPTKEPEQIASAPAAPVPIETAPPRSIPVASVSVPKAPVVAQPERPPETVHRPVAQEPAEKAFEEAVAPALPRLTLTPKAVDPRVQPIASGLPLTHEPSPLEQHWEPAPLVDVPGSNAQTPELEPVLPDISSILIQPQGRTQRPAPQIATIEGRASWDGQGVSAGGWTSRFSLSRAVTLMTILTLLAGLYVFHRNVGQGLIWLGEALGGVPRNAAPAASTNSGAIDKPVETPSAQTSPGANGGTSEKTPSAMGAGDMNAALANPAAASASAGVVAPSGSNPPLGSNANAGQSEYEQATQLLRGTNAEAATPEALRLLWISVEKGNANAELQLAEMYWKGRGVVRNCDQALILLTAAARKGSVDARERLLEFQKEGCE